jgi:hypothetical protein
MMVLDLGNTIDRLTDKQFAHGVALGMRPMWRTGHPTIIFSHNVWNALNAAAGMEHDELDFQLPLDDEDSKASALAELMTEYLRRSGYPMLPRVPTMAVGLCLEWGWFELVKSPVEFEIWFNGELHGTTSNPKWEPGPGIHFPGEKPLYGQCVELVDPVAGKSLKMWDRWHGEWHLTNEEEWDIRHGNVDVAGGKEGDNELP